MPTQEALASLVTILKSAGRLEEALGYAREEYTLARATFGDAHPEVATSCLNIGSLEGELGRAEEAITWTSRALRLFESSLPPDHPLWTTTASNLASDLSELGRCDEAVPLAERALRARRAHDGADAPRAAYPLLALAECAVARGDTPATLALTAQIRALAATLPKRVTADAWMLEAKALRLDRRRAPDAARAAREAQTLFEGEGLLAEARIAEALLTTQRTGASPP